MGTRNREHMLSKYACYGLLNSHQATANSQAQMKIRGAGELVCGCLLCNNAKVHLNSCILSLDSAFPLNYHRHEFILEIIINTHTKGNRSDLVHGKQEKNLMVIKLAVEVQVSLVI